MTKNLDQDGLSSISGNYSLFYIDLWGVVHNGISLHKEAVKVLNELQKNNKFGDAVDGALEGASLLAAAGTVVGGRVVDQVTEAVEEQTNK